MPLKDNIDYHGQRVAEDVCQYLLATFAVLGLITGAVSGSLAYCFLVHFAGLLVCALAIVPPWPWYKRHPITWLPDAIPSPVSTTPDSSVSLAPPPGL